MLGFVVLLVGGGVAALFGSWRRSLPAAFRTLGWVLIVAGATVSASATGVDRGLAIALIVLCLSGLTFVLCTLRLDADRLRSKPASRAQQSQKIVSRRGARKAASERVGLFLLAGPGAALLAFLVAVLAHQVSIGLGAAAANALVTELFLFPVLWGALAAWSLMSTNLRKQSVILIAMQCATGAGLMISGL